MVNRENVLALRDFIASEKYDFRMNEGTAYPECGSAGCIGGHAAVMWSDVRDHSPDACLSEGELTWRETLLADKLGVTTDAQRALCFPAEADGLLRTEYPHEWQSVTREDAVRVLTNLAETGEVDWSRP
jgi:hypothetical protein